jgi:hypothetical protein
MANSLQSFAMKSRFTEENPMKEAEENPMKEAPNFKIFCMAMNIFIQRSHIGNLDHLDFGEGYCMSLRSPDYIDSLPLSL